MVVLTYSAGFVILEKEKPMVMLASSTGSLVLKKVKPMVMVASSVISFILETGFGERRPMVVLTSSAGFMILEKEKPMMMLVSSAGSLVLKKVKLMVMVASSVISFVLDVATQFLTHVLINFQKNPKIVKNNKYPKNTFFIYICIVFSIFSIVSKEFKFSKFFGTRSTFNALFLKSLIFLIQVDVDKKNPKKIRKIRFTKKRERS
jgi:hypothetical protein